MKSSLRFVEFVTSVLASAFLAILMLLTFFDVIGRNVFNRPLLGATELTEYSLVAVSFLAYPLIALRHGHVSVDIFDPVFKQMGKRIFITCGDLLGAVIFGLLSYRMWIQGQRLMTYGDQTPQLGIPIAPAYFFMSILAGLTVIAFVIAAFTGDENTSGKQEEVL